jgi:hypothetical protein
LPPQTQSPAGEHASAVPSAVQSTHEMPDIPHELIDFARQTLPSQQPLGQLVASQTHVPETQRWPVPHGGSVPHAHSPFVQRSAPSSHALHASPPPPHAVSLGITHVAPEQQPSGHVVASQLVHAPPSHVLPPMQALQRPPPVPHAISASPGRQVAASQQPAHESESHTQTPAEQR